MKNRLRRYVRYLTDAVILAIFIGIFVVVNYNIKYGESWNNFENWATETYPITTYGAATLLLGILGWSGLRHLDDPSVSAYDKFGTIVISSGAIILAGFLLKSIYNAI